MCHESTYVSAMRLISTILICVATTMACGGGSDEGGGDGDGDATGDGDGDGDEGTEQRYYVDADGDGHGNALESVLSVEQPEGYVLVDDDCDDGNDAVYPEAEELCDGIDNNCDNVTDYVGPGCIEAARLYSGDGAVCFDDSDGAVYCFGGLAGDDVSPLEAQMFPNLEEPEKVWPSYQGACALQGAEVVCWNYNETSAQVVADLEDSEAFQFSEVIQVEVPWNLGGGTNGFHFGETLVSVLTTDGSVFVLSASGWSGLDTPGIEPPVAFQFVGQWLCTASAADELGCTEGQSSDESIGQGTILGGGFFMSNGLVMTFDPGPATPIPEPIDDSSDAVEAVRYLEFLDDVSVEEHFCTRTGEGGISCTSDLLTIDRTVTQIASNSGFLMVVLQDGAIIGYSVDEGVVEELRIGVVM